MSSLRITVFLCLTFFSTLLFGQNDYWKKVKPVSEDQNTFTRQLNNFDLYKLELENFAKNIPGKNDAPSQIMLPNTDGEISTFKIWDAPIMQKGLAAKFPHIRTFLIQNIEDPSMHGRVSLTNSGLKAFITSAEEPYFIQPSGQDKNTYAVFKKSDRNSVKEFRCHYEGEHFEQTEVTQRSVAQIGDRLRIYRLAVSTTGEYSSFHGGNTGSVLEAIVETINQVNVVYENDFSVRFILVDNNDLLINLDADKDPFDNFSASQMLQRNPSQINSIIGVNNYDLGHVFATGGAGLASLASSCVFDKAQGITGINPPEGSTFAIDYVAHELGHQLGSNHTFNNCGGQEVPSVAFEPGSGSTIMAYAGLCGSNNVQFSSDAYFHVSSLIQISNWINNTGGNCTEMIDTENSIPTVDAGEGGFFIPIETPFKLTAQGEDADGDELTYCWEQYNTGPQSDYGEPIGNAPSFRSFKPVDSPTRFFPKLNLVVAGSQPNSEVLPSASRDLNFQCTVRDNKPGGGAAAWDQISFESTDQAGPFIVTSQNESDVVWETNRLATVTWDVANTDQAPINCEKVNIIMSRTLGITFDIILAENVDNNGSHTFFVPEDAISNFARVMVEAADNVFYNVNSEQFKVVEGIASSVDESFQSSINIFPNPSDGKFVLEMNTANSNSSEAQILDVQGRLIKTFTVNTDREELLLDVPPGMYFLKVRQEGKLAVKKLVVSQ